MSVLMINENMAFLRPVFLYLLPLLLLFYGLLAVLIYRQRRVRKPSQFPQRLQPRHRHRGADDWQSVFDPDLLQVLQARSANYREQDQNANDYVAMNSPDKTPNQSSRRSPWVYPLVLGLWLILGIVTLAGPSWQQQAVPQASEVRSLVVVLSLAPSMLAEDIKPNRLQRGKYLVQDFLRSPHPVETALVAYTDSAYVVSPLTDDSATVLNLLQALTPELMPTSGNQVIAGLEKAQRLLQQANQRTHKTTLSETEKLGGGDILLISDGIDGADRDALQKTIAQLNQHNIRVSILGIGSQAGAPIPSADGLLKDHQGRLIFSQLQRENLQNLAEQTGGKILWLTPESSLSNSAQNLLDTNLASHLASDFKASSHLTDSNQSANDSSDQQIPLDNGGYFLPILLLLFLWLCRRPWPFIRVTVNGISVVVMVLIFAASHLPFPSLAQTAVEPSPPKQPSIWQNASQQAYEGLISGEDLSRAQTVTDPEIAAAAYYRSQQFAAAAQHYQESIDKLAQNPKKTPVQQQLLAQNYYNYANGLAQSGQLAVALEAYQQATTILDQSGRERI